MSKIEETTEFHFGLRTELKRASKIKRILIIIVVILLIALGVCTYYLVTKTDILKKTTTTTTKVITTTKVEIDENNTDFYLIPEGYIDVTSTKDISEDRNMDYLLGARYTVGSVYSLLLQSASILPTVNIIETNENKIILVEEYIENIIKRLYTNNEPYIMKMYNDINKTIKVLGENNSTYSYKLLDSIGSNIFEEFNYPNKTNINIKPSNGVEVNIIDEIVAKYQNDNEYIYIINIKNSDTNEENYYKITYHTVNDINYLTGIYKIK